MNEFTGHVREEWFDAWKNRRLTREEECVMLRHISCCDYCADRFAALLEEEPEEVPAYLEEEILERSKGADVKAVRAVYQTSRRMRLLIYSLKVGVAVTMSLFLLFGTSGIRTDAIRVRWPQGKERLFFISRELDEKSEQFGGRLNQFMDRLWNMNEEEAYD